MGVGISDTVPMEPVKPYTVEGVNRTIQCCWCWNCKLL